MYSLLALVACVAPFALASPAANAGAGKFTYYDLHTPLASPCDLTTGPDGQIWVDTLTSNKIVKINKQTGKLTEYDIPYTAPLLPNSTLLSQLQGTIAGACVVQPGRDGNVYFATGLRDQFGRINPKTNKVEVFGTLDLLGNLEPLNDAWPGPTGMFFSQTTNNVITLLDYKTTTFKSFPVPTKLSGPVGIKYASDDGLWFTEFLAGKVSRLNATSGHIDEFPVPAALIGPAVMRAETKGRYLWFVATIGSAIGRIDMFTHEFKAFPFGDLNGVPIENTVDNKGNIWFSTATANNLNFLTPSTGKFTAIEQPDTLLPLPVGIPPAGDIAIHYDESTNAIWFTELAKNRVGKYQL